MKKERLDTLLVEKGMFESREKAKKSIMTGTIFVAGQRCDKAGMRVDKEALIEIRGKTLPYVSRGGLKLEKAINEFDLSLQDKICIDIGSSTGGFTDCMLQQGAKKVYAIDVGYGQLAYKLRKDPRVIVMERTNIREVVSKDLQEKADFISIDVSFISLNLVLPVAKELMAKNGSMVALIKPQFEAGKGKVGKNGVIRDSKLHKEIILHVLDFIKKNYSIKDLSFSPIRGPKGNIEFLAYLSNQNKTQRSDLTEMVQNVVREAHSSFNKEK